MTENINLLDMLDLCLLKLLEAESCEFCEVFFVNPHPSLTKIQQKTCTIFIQRHFLFNFFYFENFQSRAVYNLLNIVFKLDYFTTKKLFILQKKHVILPKKTCLF